MEKVSILNVLTWIVSVLALGVAGVGIWLSQEANTLSKEALEHAQSAFSETQRPRLILNIARTSDGRYLQFTKKRENILFVTSVKIWNIGNTPAAEISYPRTTLTVELLDKTYKVDMEDPPGKPLSLGPQQDFLYNAKAEITGFPPDKEELILKQLSKGEAVLELEVQYKDDQTSEQYSTSAKYLLVGKNADILHLSND